MVVQSKGPGVTDLRLCCEGALTPLGSPVVLQEIGHVGVCV
jgi:hypothetical protein